MSELVRFKTDDNKRVKVRIFERASRKRVCVCCGRRTWGMAFRHLAPNKIPDTLICYECLVKISLGITIQIDKDNKFGIFSESKIVNSFRRRGKNKPGPLAGQSKSTQVNCPYCDGSFTERGLHLHILAKHSKQVWQEDPPVYLDTVELPIENKNK